MKLNPREVEKVMRRMGIESEEIVAQEVIIKTQEKDIVISSPHVTKVNMMGQETFQITGEVRERPSEKFSVADGRMIMKQTGASEEEVREALEETGDIAESILRLKKAS